VFFAIGDHGVASIAATLEADNDIAVLGQVIDDPSFALVSPLKAYNGHTFIHEC
jgi:hypothetical protein